MAKNSVKTIHLDLIENARTKGDVYVPLPFSTLNQKFNHLHTETQPAGYPVIGYLAIGNGGHGIAAGNAGRATFDRYQHEVTDACLFNQIPFVVRERNNDLSQAERAKYRFRRYEEHAGNFYWVYYLKKVTFLTAEPQVEILTTVNGVTTTQPFEPTSAMLNPQPLPMSNGEVVDITGRKISVQSPIGLNLNADDIRNIIEACEIVYGSRREAVISELALVAGYDKTVSSTEGGQSVTYTDLVTAQCVSFIRELHALDEGSTLLELGYELGNVQTYRS